MLVFIRRNLITFSIIYFDDYVYVDVDVDDDDDDCEIKQLLLFMVQIDKRMVT